jgi:hypothetical protein
VLLSELTASAARLALVGLAKNTGKTEALAALLRELEQSGRRVGVTSVGRDGEQHDVIDARIDKPPVVLPVGSLVATTDALLSASGLSHELLEQPDVRTPLGAVVVARIGRPGAIEVAGPSAAADVRAVCDAMLAHGAEQILIDGAIDRRAASSPLVADALVMSTGAVLSAQLEEVVARTSDAVELVRLEAVAEPRVRDAFAARHSALLAADGPPVRLPPRFVLTSDAEQLTAALDAQPDARWLVVDGALPEPFLATLLSVLRRGRRELTVVAGDSTRVFVSDHGPDWYARQGLRLAVLRPIELRALTVNPVAPRSHSFDSGELREALAADIADVEIFDVLDPAYRALAQETLARPVGAARTG